MVKSINIFISLTTLLQICVCVTPSYSGTQSETLTYSRYMTAIDTVHQRLNSIDMGSWKKNYLKLFTTVITTSRQEKNKELQPARLDDSVGELQSTFYKLLVIGSNKNDLNRDNFSTYYQLASSLDDWKAKYSEGMRKASKNSPLIDKLIVKPIHGFTKKFIAYQSWQLQRVYNIALLDSPSIEWDRMSATVGMVQSVLEVGPVAVNALVNPNSGKFGKITKTFMSMMSSTNSTDESGNKSEQISEVLGANSEDFKALADYQKPTEDQYRLFLRKAVVYMGQGTAMVAFCIAIDQLRCALIFTGLISITFVVWVTVLMQYLDERNQAQFL